MAPGNTSTRSVQGGARTNVSIIEQLTIANKELQERIEQLEAMYTQQAVQQAQKKLKTNNLIPFKGEQSKLRVFLAQMQLYFSINTH
jgi:hypothetical protein